MKKIEPNLLKIDRTSVKNTGIYNTGYITIKNIDDCKNIYSVNPLYLFLNHGSGYIEERKGNKYLIFDSTDENKESIKKYQDVFSGIKNKIEAVSSGECEYEKDFMKIKYNFDDHLPLNKPLKFHIMTIIIRSVFEEDGKLYPQDFLDDALYELNIKNVNCKQRIKYQNTTELIFQNELLLIKQVSQKNVIFVTIGILKTLVLNMNRIFVMAVTM